MSTGYRLTVISLGLMIAACSAPQDTESADESEPEAAATTVDSSPTTSSTATTTTTRPTTTTTRATTTTTMSVSPELAFEIWRAVFADVYQGTFESDFPRYWRTPSTGSRASTGSPMTNSPTS